MFLSIELPPHNSAYKVRSPSRQLDHAYSITASLTVAGTVLQFYLHCPHIQFVCFAPASDDGVEPLATNSEFAAYQLVKSVGDV